MIREPESSEALRAAVARLRDAVRLDHAEPVAMGTWFPGPVGENEQLLTRLVELAVKDHSVARRVAYPDDPPWIDTTSPAHARHAARLETQLQVLLRRLARYSIPWYGYRYHAHMNWDNTIPSLAGYFAAMLYNQNNVAGEGSPVTTALEIEVAADLCRMLGFGEEPGVKPWGHLTSGGTVANIEALWAARNVKFYPFAVLCALRSGEIPHPDFAVPLPAGGDPKPLRELTAWEVLNLRIDDVLAIPGRLQKETGLGAEDLEPIRRYTIQETGLMGTAIAFTKNFPEEPKAGSMAASLAFLAPATRHYSMPKASTLLGMGTRALIPVPIDARARMDFDALERILQQARAASRPIAAVVAVAGTTQEGAVDPIEEIVNLRERLRRDGFEFAIHVDAAWGGYFCSLLRPPPDWPSPEEVDSAIRGRIDTKASDLAAHRSMDPDLAAGLDDDRREPLLAHLHLEGIFDFGADPELPPHESMVYTAALGLSRYTIRQLRALSRVDTITVDPHKAGFTPYPAGALCYRNQEMPGMIKFTAPIVSHDESVPTVGTYGVEGSRPGAAAAGVWLSHRVIRPDQSGYGTILGRCMVSARRFFAAVASMASHRFTVCTLQKLTEAEIALLARLTPLDHREFMGWLGRDPEAATLFRELGSDLLVNTFALNFRWADKTLNTDPELANLFNDRVYKRLSLDVEGDTWPPIVITGSRYDKRDTGDDFVDGFRERLGLRKSNLPLAYLVTTTANPWLFDADHGTVNMIPRIVVEMQAEIEDEVEKLLSDLEKEGRPRSWG